MAQQADFDAILQVFWLERLDDVVIRPHIHPSLDVVAHPKGREEDDGDVSSLRVSLQHRAEIATFELGHHDVEQDEIRLVCLHELQPFLAACGRQRLIAPTLKTIRQQQEELLIIIHD